MKNLIQRFKSFNRKYKGKRIRFILNKIVKSNTSAHEIAFGFSIGLFLSILPTFGIGMILAIIIAIKKKLNIISTYLGTLVVNPFTAPFFYLADYTVGALLIGNSNIYAFPTTFHQVTLIAAQLYLGGFIFATATAIFSYIFIYSIINYFRKYS